MRWWLTCLGCASGLLVWAGGARATQLDLSLPGANAGEARLAVDPSGDVVAVWERVGTDGSRIVQAAARDGWTFGSRVDLSLPGRNADAPAVAIDQAGGAVVVWQRFSEFGHWVVQGATRAADGTIVSLGDLSDTNSDDEAPQVAVDSAGDAVAVWEQDDHQRNIVSIQAAARSAGGGLVSLGELSVPGQSGMQDDESPQVALDRAGDAFAVWEHFDGTNFVVQSAVRPAGATKFGAPVDVSLPQSTAHEDAVDPQLAVDPAGDEIVVWALGGGSDGRHWAVQAAARPAGLRALAPRKNCRSRARTRTRRSPWTRPVTRSRSGSVSMEQARSLTRHRCRRAAAPGPRSSWPPPLTLPRPRWRSTPPATRKRSGMTPTR